MEIHELYARFYGELTAYAVRLTGSHAAAQDLTQEAFLRALTQMRETGRPVNRAWLYRTARNLFIDQRRRYSREVFSDDARLDLVTCEQDLTQPMAAQLIARLPENERALFILRHFKGYNASELGRMFSLPPATVRARLASARRRLKSFLAQ